MSGTEIGLWNALDLQVDWFKEQRRDIFMQRNNIPSAAGFRKTPWANYGKVDNIGVDLSLTYNQQITKRFAHWSQRNVYVCPQYDNRNGRSAWYFGERIASGRDIR